MSWKEYIVKNDQAGLSLVEFIRQELQISARNYQSLTRAKGIRLNRKISHSKRILKENDVVGIRQKEDTLTIKAQKGKLTILYEDEYSLVLDKPPFLLVHPTATTKEDTLSNYVAQYYQDNHVIHAIRPVHRLDRNTSGCILFAKTKEAHRYYSEELQENKILRMYQALVNGHISSEYKLSNPSDGYTHCIDKPIGIDPKRGNRRRIDEKGKAAKTYFRIIEEFDSTTLLELTIPTGRTHQIRVHLAYIGHSVVGDSMYGNCPSPFTRQCLHATNLIFTPYQHKKKIEVLSPLPIHFGQELSPK